MSTETIKSKRIFVHLKIVCLAMLGVNLNSCAVQSLPYNFGAPDEVHKLEKSLNEISGLHWVDSETMACVQDEKANIYFLDLSTGEVSSKIDFGKTGDFEGITQVDDKFYALRSDGDIYEIDQSGKSIKNKFPDSKGFDFEGLCADPKENRLLVACKEHGDKSQRDSIHIYSFSLQSFGYDKDPYLVIAKEGIHSNFKPSGIAMHPNGDLYILSSASRTLLVLNKDGSQKYQIQLDKAKFQQPEGISFSASGTLYISNEKRNDYPSLLKFNPQTPSP